MNPLRDFRELHKMTAEMLCDLIQEKTGKNYRAEDISRWENFHCRPHVSVLRAVEEATGVTGDQMLAAWWAARKEG